MSPVPNCLADSEPARLTALHSLQILDTEPERAFDQLTRLAALALGVETAAVSLVDADRQWFKSRHNLGICETPREQAVCDYTIRSGELFVVPDLAADPRFAGNPLVMAEDGLRFYAGAPLVTSGGHRLGALCALDRRPRARLSETEARTLSDLAHLTVELIETRRLRQVGDVATQVVDATPDAVLCTDAGGHILFWNAAAERMFGYTAADAIGRKLDLIIPERLAGAHHHGLARAAAGGPTTLIGGSVEVPAKRADGSEFPVELSLARWGAVRASHGFAAIIRDASARKSLERAREQTQAFLDAVVENLPAMLFVKDTRTGEYVLVNRAGEELIGRPRDALIGRTDRELFPATVPAYARRDGETLIGTGGEPFESAFMRDDGRMVNVRTRRIVIDGPDAPGQYLLGMSEDVTEIRRAEAEVLRLARSDSLTGLLNRHSYVNRLHELLASATPFALLAIDLDRFKAVNDQFGHLVGDAVLVEVGTRLAGLVGRGDMVARVGGDEFMLLLVGKKAATRARQVAEGAVACLARPYATARVTAHLGASIGVVLAPDDAGAIQDLRHRADLALYRAKESGRGAICFYSPEMDDAARDRLSLERDLRSAIDRDEITLAYQPVLAAVTGRITSAEALARWTHPGRGPIRPDLFISIAEECGLIERLGSWVLRQACMDATGWPEDVRVAVNLSPLQFRSGNLYATVTAALSASGLAPGRLQLEVTESLVIQDVERTFVELERLRALGIQILMDDFGTGYCSLSYFERFPFDKVKIDQSFVRRLERSQAAGAIIRAIVGLGDALGMGVVAEGVETQSQMETLVAAGCTHLQGYLFSRPVPGREIAALLSAGAAARAGEAVARSSGLVTQTG